MVSTKKTEIRQKIVYNFLCVCFTCVKRQSDTFLLMKKRVDEISFSFHKFPHGLIYGLKIFIQNENKFGVFGGRKRDV